MSVIVVLRQRLSEAVIMGSLSSEQQVTIAAGCFWGVELAFQRVPNVTKVRLENIHETLHAAYARRRMQ